MDKGFNLSSCDKTGLYIHIPFCKTLCSYCDFTKKYYVENWASDYLLLLEKEITKRVHGDIDTIYIGGGTPSALDMFQSEQLLKLLGDKSKNLLEFTIEMNPEDITTEKIILYRKYGVTRISVGIQDVNNKILSSCKRDEINDWAEKITILKNSGCAVNFDFIIGLPHQTKEHIRRNLQFIEKWHPEHVSIYPLQIEKETLLYKKGFVIDEDFVVEMWHWCKQILKSRGYSNYEIANFCLPAQQSRHNLKYWEDKNYYGVGVSAASYIDGTLTTNTKSIAEYKKGLIEDEKYSDIEIYTNQMQIEKMLMMGLRLERGISINAIEKKYQVEFQKFFEDFLVSKQQYLEVKDGYIRVKEQYREILHEIIVDLVGE